MKSLLEGVERLANETYKKYVSTKTSLVLADVLADVIIKQGIEVIYLNIPKRGNEDRMLYGMFFKTDQSIKPQIIINQLDSIRTQSFTLAYGWFHTILEAEQLKDYTIQMQSKEEIERSADYFAASILMRQEVFISYFELMKELSLEKLVFKLADIFKVPYVSVVRRLNELNLIEVSTLASLTEKELIEIRNNSVGKSILDSRPRSYLMSKWPNSINTYQ